MAYYPIFVEMKGRRCVVIGGGTVAQRKVEGLLRAGASVTVISHTVAEQLRLLAEAGRIGRVARPYQPGDLAGFQFAFVATDDAAVTAAVRREAEKLGVLMNAADDPAQCDFILPSVLHREDLTVAVATGGASPALSKAIREELELYFTEDYAVLAKITAEVRRELREQGLYAEPGTWEQALSGDLRNLLRRGDIEGAKRYLRDRLGS
jgi:precorrin-2 dehydrogenase/sirohydrochlorin ferrochelatase